MNLPYVMRINMKLNLGIRGTHVGYIISPVGLFIPLSNIRSHGPIHTVDPWGSLYTPLQRWLMVIHKCIM